MKIIVSHSGKQHSYHVARSLLQLGLLDTFYTSSYVRNVVLQNYFLRRGNTYWTRRFLEGLGGNYVKANWHFEIKEIIYRKMYGKTSKAQNAVYQRDENFDRYVSHQLKKHAEATHFWGFQGSCLETLKKANELGKTTLCELATAHVVAAKQILGEESKLHPEWADSIDNLVFPSHYEKRLQQEPHVAQYAVAASEFTKQTLLADGVPESKIIKLPLGFDVDYIPYQERKDDITQRPLRLLYAGTVTQRKGIKYLLQALQQLNTNEVELHIVGGIQGSGTAFKQYKKVYQYHPPVSQLEMYKKYAEFDALVLPTVFEGFGLVIVEAMAAGLPVITTPHSMGPDLIENDKNGYLIPIRDIAALQQAITTLRQKNKNDYLQMRQNAAKSVQAFSWKNYKENLANVVKNI
jgi:glycosyltransferase involved in cell wall biosynthesis